MATMASHGPMSAPVTSNVLSTQQNPMVPNSHVGFDSITSQIERKLLKRGFQFNVICVGESLQHVQALNGTKDGIGQTGLGKSTLINTIFASHLIDSKGRLAPDEAVRSTTEIQAVSHGTYIQKGLFCSAGLMRCDAVIEENGVRLRLNIVDTPGYGDQVNNDRWYELGKSLQENNHSSLAAGTPLSSTSKTSIRPTSDGS